MQLWLLRGALALGAIAVAWSATHWRAEPLLPQAPIALTNAPPGPTVSTGFEMPRDVIPAAEEFKLALARPEPAARLAAIFQLAQRWGEVECEAAAREAVQRADLYPRDEIVRMVLLFWTQTAGDKAVPFAAAHLHDPDVAAAFIEIASQWRTSNPGLFEAWFASLQPGQSLNLARLARIHSLAQNQSSLEIAKRQALELDVPDTIQTFDRGLLERLFSFSVGETEAWVLSLPQGPLQNAALHRLAAIEAPSRGRPFCRTLLEEFHPEAAVAVAPLVGRLWGEDASADALDFALSLTNAAHSAFRTAFFRGFGQAEAMFDPPSAASNVLHTAATPADRTARLAGIAHTWAQRDARDAAAWASSLVDDQDRAAATGPVVDAWIQSDAESALRWVRSLPHSAARRHGLIQAARALFPWDPSNAIALLQSEQPHPEVDQALATFASRRAETVANPPASTNAPTPP